MAITKILARKGRLDTGIRYILNGDKTEDRILTTYLNCDPGNECRYRRKISYTDTTELSTAMVNALIEKITVGERVQKEDGTVGQTIGAIRRYRCLLAFEDG